MFGLQEQTIRVLETKSPAQAPELPLPQVNLVDPDVASVDYEELV